MLNRHRLLVDLHSGTDPQLGAERLAGMEVRVVPLGDEGADLHARTIIPPQVWRNLAFRYLGLEIYLPEPAKDWQAARELARELIGIAARCVGAGCRACRWSACGKGSGSARQRMIIRYKRILNPLPG
ncbi:hypothetical protein [Azotobacter beijerinckii]|uniref:Uncharacterized protein n=1 Tax=Azotobacter beijerinckii TaxID=170623 RepID=A0A1I4HZF2_9GAMM|nr:hypothetical protein [Azotobacter beijerinckii]SFB63279.1 hypothetical protein SAMN04244571_04521 [Azotobacter beijerinckii]SFL47217.1 hypothetical protein SAMN04244574_04412 [Azotobacter beijerinckii]